jgi:hypothetical protein
MHRPPEHLPNPWLFDTEELLRELARCREIVLLIPAPTHEAHFAANIAIDTIWNLEEHVRYLLRLHREGQSSWARIHRDLEHSLQENPITGAKGMDQKRQLRDLEQRITNLQGQLASMKNQFSQDVTTSRKTKLSGPPARKNSSIVHLHTAAPRDVATHQSRRGKATARENRTLRATL